MSSPALISVATPIGDVNHPSPSVWADCKNTLLPDLGLGLFVNRTFEDGQTNLNIATGTSTDAGTNTVDSGTVSDAALKLATSANAGNDAISAYVLPLGSIAKGSGQKFWLEASIAPGSLFQGAFAFGLTVSGGLSKDLIANTPSTSGQAALASDSFVGFVTEMSSSAIKTVDAVYKNGSATTVTVASNVGNSVAFTQPNTSTFPGGSGTATVAPGNLASATLVKYGIRYDGQQYITFYVNGVAVAKYAVDATFDQTHDLGAILTVKTSTTVSAIVYADFFRVAQQTSY